MSFKNLLSHNGILAAIEDAGYTAATPIQQEAIPLILEGADLLASAQTGTGKTAAFLLPVLQRLTLPSSSRGKGPRVLILAPTRELVMQITSEAEKYSRHLSRVKTVAIYGGAPYPVQNRQLAGYHEILVATPGRLIDHIDRGRIDFSRLEVLILDEADRMLDMGFIEPVERIASCTPASRQTLLFSATLKGPVLKLSQRLLRDPKRISVSARQITHDHIEQRLHTVDNLEHKYRLLDTLLQNPALDQVVVFTATKSQADILADKLVRAGHRAKALHGDMRQRERAKTLTLLRQQEIQILVATDVAARGIDVQTISHVINFDLPMSAEDYVHRIGRTGRAGRSGCALSFVSRRDFALVRKIEQFTGMKMTAEHDPRHPAEKASIAPRTMRRRPSASRRS